MSGLSRGHGLAIAAALFVGATVIASVVINPPQEARKRKLDELRIEDLNMIRNWIAMYWNGHNKTLPPDLAALPGGNSTSLREQDPETGQSYIYEITGNNSYKLCAVFSLSAENNHYYCCDPDQIGSHDAGKFCYSLTLK